MKVSTNPPFHLSYHEVLTHFLTLKEDNDYLQSSIKSRKARTKAQAKRDYPLLRDAEEENVDDEEEVLEDLSEEVEEGEKVAERRGISPSLVWVQDEVIKYLCSDYNPTTRQTEDGVALLADELQEFGLTKAEVLQCCNSAPTSRVNLYAIIEEPETRFKPDPEQTLASIQSLISSTLLETPPDHLQPYIQRTEEHPIDTGLEGAEGGGEWEVNAEEEMMTQEFVTEAAWGGEGGVEEEKDGEIDS